MIVGYYLAGDGAAAAIPGLFVFVVVFYRLKPQIQAFSDLRVKLARILPKMEIVADFLRREDKDYEAISGEEFNRLESGLIKWKGQDLYELHHYLRPLENVA